MLNLCVFLTSTCLPWQEVSSAGPVLTEKFKQAPLFPVTLSCNCQVELSSDPALAVNERGHSAWNSTAQGEAGGPHKWGHCYHLPKQPIRCICKGVLSGKMPMLNSVEIFPIPSYVDAKITSSVCPHPPVEMCVNCWFSKTRAGVCAQGRYRLCHKERMSCDCCSKVHFFSPVV